MNDLDQDGHSQSLMQYFSLDFLRNLLTDRQMKAVSKPSNSYALETLYQLLYSLREKRRTFVSSLDYYSHAVDGGASKLEVEYRLNDVGIATQNLNEALGEVKAEFSRLGAEMSIRNPEIERATGSYIHSRDLQMTSILDEHDLSSADPIRIREALAAAKQNGKMFEEAIDKLQREIVAQRSKAKGQVPQN